MIALALAGAALAGNASIGLAGGRDLSTDQWWSGLDLSLNPAQDHGLSAFGRVQGGYGFIDGPLGALEIGATGVVPNDQAIVRFGGLVRTAAIYAEYPAAVRPFGAGAKGDPAFGLLPGGEILVEFEWGKENPFTLRLAGGTGSEAAAALCEPTDATYDCVKWQAGFLGGVTARGRLRNGLYGEVVAGPSPSLVLGYGFPVRGR